MKPEVIIVKQENNGIVFKNLDEFYKLLDKFYDAGYEVGKNSNTTPSDNPYSWVNIYPYDYSTPGTAKDWSQQIVYTTSANDDIKID